MDPGREARDRDLAGLDLRIDPGHRATELAEVLLETLQGLMRPDAEAEVAQARLGAEAEAQAVMQPFLEAAKVERVVGLLGDDEAEQVDVEGPRAGEVGDDELGMGGPHDVERRRDPVGIHQVLLLLRRQA